MLWPSPGSCQPTRDSRMGKVTGLLRSWANGDQHAFHSLYGEVYEELRSLARKIARLPRGGGSTAIVHDLFVKVHRTEGQRPATRTGFFRFMSRAMMNHLRDAARLRKHSVPVDDRHLSTSMRSWDRNRLDDMLLDLRRLNPVQADVFVMKCLRGMTTQEIARTTGWSPSKIDHAWLSAKAFVVRYLKIG